MKRLFVIVIGSILFLSGCSALREQAKHNKDRQWQYYEFRDIPTDTFTDTNNETYVLL